MADQATILDALVSLLQTKLLLDDRHVYQTTAPPGSSSGNPQSGDFWVTVMPGGSSFADGQFQDGGGAAQVTDFAEAIVTGYTRIRLDNTDRDNLLLGDLNRGLFPVKQKILGALVGQQLFDDENNPLLRSLLAATRAEAPAYDKDQATGWVSIAFRTDFDWTF